MKNSLLHKLAQLFGIKSYNPLAPSNVAGLTAHSVHHHDKHHWDNKTEIHGHQHNHIHPVKGKDTSHHHKKAVGRKNSCHSTSHQKSQTTQDGPHTTHG